MPYSATRISDLLATDGAESALAHCHVALEQAPGDASLHHVCGRALNNLGRLPEALAALTRAVELESANALMLAHRGHVLLRLARHDEAAEDFRQAVALDGTQLTALQGLATICMNSGQSAEAIEWLAQLCECEPDNHRHWVNLGLTQHETGLLHDAEQAFRIALKMAPGDADACCGLASALQSQGRLDEARGCFTKVLEMNAGHPQASAGLAGIYALQNKPDEATRLLRPLLTDAPGEVDPVLRLAMAQLHHKAGDIPEAETQLQAVLVHDQASRLQKSTAHLSLASIFDKQGQYAEALAEAKKGNLLRARNYPEKNHGEWLERSRQIFSGDVLEKFADVSNEKMPVIFIVGMPRSGTSLVEQILDCHSNVYGAGELDFIARLAAELPDRCGSSKVYPECLEDMAASDLQTASADLAARYAALTGMASMVSDKMWQNFEFLGFIQLLLPDARIIHCRRDPRDTGLSCFLQGFGVAGPPFSYSLPGIVHYYHQYHAMMTYWKARLTTPLLDVQYEDMVDDPEAQIRRLLVFLDLDWEPACLDFHRNRRLVRTASSEQVQQPIYQSSVGRYHHYQEQLADFFSQLHGNDDE